MGMSAGAQFPAVEPTDQKYRLDIDVQVSTRTMISGLPSLRTEGCGLVGAIQALGNRQWVRCATAGLQKAAEVLPAPALPPEHSKDGMCHFPRTAVRTSMRRWGTVLTFPQLDLDTWDTDTDTGAGGRAEATLAQK